MHFKNNDNHPGTLVRDGASTQVPAESLPAPPFSSVAVALAKASTWAAGSSAVPRWHPKFSRVPKSPFASVKVPSPASILGIAAVILAALTSGFVRRSSARAAPAKRAHEKNMRAFCRHARKRFEPTHGDILNLHTERREGGRGGRRGSLFSLSSLLSLFLLLSPFRRSLPSFSFSFSSLLSQ